MPTAMIFRLDDALWQYLDSNEWQIQAIQQGIADADAGRFIDHDELKGKWEKHRATAMD